MWFILRRMWRCSTTSSNTFAQEIIVNVDRLHSIHFKALRFAFVWKLISFCSFSCLVSVATLLMKWFHVQLLHFYNLPLASPLTLFVVPVVVCIGWLTEILSIYCGQFYNELRNTRNHNVDERRRKVYPKHQYFNYTSFGKWRKFPGEQRLISKLEHSHRPTAIPVMFGDTDSQSHFGEM